MTIDVKAGLPLSMIMAIGEDPSMYGSLTANTINVTSERVATINALLIDLANVDPDAVDADAQEAAIVAQIITLAEDEAAAVAERVQTDLIAQETLMNSNISNDLIHVNVPFNAPSQLFNLVATPLLKTLSEEIIKRRLDQDRE